MIRSFRCAQTELLFRRLRTRRFAAIEEPARRRLLRLSAATSLDDLAALPGNRLEKLSGNRSGQYSIRINQQWRICFLWQAGNAYDVEIVDYH
jgi:proteic killer suppression protein